MTRQLSTRTSQASGQLAPLSIHVYWHDATATMTIAGELDCATAPVLSERLATTLAQQPQRLVLDLAHLTFIDCAGLAPILRARRALSPSAALVLRSVTPATRHFLAVAKVSQLLASEDG